MSTKVISTTNAVISVDGVPIGTAANVEIGGHSELPLTFSPGSINYVTIKMPAAHGRTEGPCRFEPPACVSYRGYKRKQAPTWQERALRYGRNSPIAGPDPLPDWLQ